MNPKNLRIRKVRGSQVGGHIKKISIHNILNYHVTQLLQSLNINPAIVLYLSYHTFNIMFQAENFSLICYFVNKKSLFSFWQIFYYFSCHRNFRIRYLCNLYICAVFYKENSFFYCWSNFKEFFILQNVFFFDPNFVSGPSYVLKTFLKHNLLRSLFALFKIFAKLCC